MKLLNVAIPRSKEYSRMDMKIDGARVKREREQRA